MASELAALPTLRVRLLGGFGVGRDGEGTEVSAWQRRSAKTLTKLLAAHPSHALHREQILDILWPGADLESALNSFGKALHAARRAIEPELVRRQNSAYLRLEDAMLALDMDHVVIDADRFEQLAQDALRGTDARALESALAVYGGELLPEDRYEDWCAERRGYLTELHIRVLLARAEAFEQTGAYNEAADRLRAVLQKDQTREEVHRRLMRLYAEMGTPDQAVRQFHRCEQVLRRELDLTPSRRRSCSSRTSWPAASRSAGPPRNVWPPGPARAGGPPWAMSRSGRSSAAGRCSSTFASSSPGTFPARA